MSGKVGRPRKDGVIGWTEKQVWQPDWVNVFSSLVLLAFAFLSFGVGETDKSVGFSHNVLYMISGAFTVAFLTAVIFSLFQSERLKVVKE